MFCFLQVSASSSIDGQCVDSSSDVSARSFICHHLCSLLHSSSLNRRQDQSSCMFSCCSSATVLLQFFCSSSAAVLLHQFSCSFPVVLLHVSCHFDEDPFHVSKHFCTLCIWCECPSQQHACCFYCTGPNGCQHASNACRRKPYFSSPLTAACMLFSIVLGLKL